MRRVAVACALLACLALPASGAAKRGDRVERRAERAVLGAVKAKRNLPSERRASCRRVKRSPRASCRWRGARRLTPNRVRRCQGRYRVRVKRGKARLRSSGRTRCRVAVKAADPELGFNDIAIGARTASPEQVANVAEGAGAGLFRMTVDWRWVERRRGTYDLRVYDRAYRELLARGIRPLLVLSAAPTWAWPPLTLCPSTCTVPPDPSFDADWRRIAGELARRYPRAAGIEVWNEPNERVFWRTGPNPRRYADLLRQAHGAIKAARPAMPVIGGGLSSREVEEGGSLAGAPFLRAVLEAGGRGHMEGVGIHPYVRSFELGKVRQVVGSFRAARNAGGAAHLPLWTTEVGLTTTGGSKGTTLEGQASGLVYLYRTLKAEPGMDSVILHSLIEPRGLQSPTEQGFGLVRPNLSPKPAYCALRRAVGLSGRCG